MRFRKRILSLAGMLAVVCVIGGQARAQSVFMTQYYDVATSNSPSASGYGGHGASGGVGDGLVRLVNYSDIDSDQNGTLCAMIYVFDDIEEMQACCGCPVTPDGLRTMSVINNVTKNFGVNRGNLNAGVIDVVSSGFTFASSKPIPLPPQIGPAGASGLACDPSGQYGAQVGADFRTVTPEPGIVAFETHTEGNVPVPASANLTKGTSVSEFQAAFLDKAHLSELQSFCGFLISNGSGTGACSCGSGDDFSKVPGPPPI